MMYKIRRSGNQLSTKFILMALLLFLLFVRLFTPLSGKQESNDLSSNYHKMPVQITGDKNY